MSSSLGDEIESGVCERLLEPKEKNRDALD